MLVGMKRSPAWLLGLGMLGVVGCAGGQEDRGTLEAVPRAAAAALHERSGGGVRRVERELEGGVEMWEGSWLDAAGRRHELKVTADGRVVEHEVEVAEGEVPAAVRATAVRVLGAGASYVKVVTTGNYEAERIVEGKERDVMIAPDGRVVGDEGEAGEGGDHGDGGDDGDDRDEGGAKD